MTGAEVIQKLITIISIALLFFTLSLGISYAETEKTSLIILRVSNLTCSDCHGAIINGLLQLDKNILMNSDRNKRSLIITYPDTLEDKEIVRAIQKLGYKVGIETSQTKRQRNCTYSKRQSCHVWILHKHLQCLLQHMETVLRTLFRQK